MSNGESRIVKILTEDEVKAILAEVREKLGEAAVQAALAAGRDLEGMVRFFPVTERCQKVREDKRVSLDDAAQAIDAKPEAIQAIETADLPRIQPGTLHRYLSYLKIDRWFSEWSKSNPQLASRWKEHAEAAGKPAERRRGQEQPQRGGRQERDAKGERGPSAARRRRPSRRPRSKPKREGQPNPPSSSPPASPSPSPGSE